MIVVYHFIKTSLLTISENHPQLRIVIYIYLSDIVNVCLYLLYQLFNVCTDLYFHLFSPKASLKSQRMPNLRCKWDHLVLISSKLYNRKNIFDFPIEIKTYIFISIIMYFEISNVSPFCLFVFFSLSFHQKRRKST